MSSLNVISTPVENPLAPHGSQYDPRVPEHDHQRQYDTIDTNEDNGDNLRRSPVHDHPDNNHEHPVTTGAAEHGNINSDDDIEYIDPESPEEHEQ